jgi:hypothetical protein
MELQKPKKQAPRIPTVGPNTDVMIQSETWLDKVESVYLKGFDMVRKERNE